MDEKPVGSCEASDFDSNECSFYVILSRPEKAWERGGES